jgi:hypothetical protein
MMRAGRAITGTIGAVTTPDSGAESPREAVARGAAEAYAELAEVAADPELPDRARELAQTLGSLFADMGAEVIGQEIRAAEQEQHTAELEAIFLGDDMSVLAGVLKRRLTREQLADLIVRLDSPS